VLFHFFSFCFLLSESPPLFSRLSHILSIFGTAHSLFSPYFETVESTGAMLSEALGVTLNALSAYLSSRLLCLSIPSSHSLTITSTAWFSPFPSRDDSFPPLHFLLFSWLIDLFDLFLLG
jgi:hypothetical protein